MTRARDVANLGAVTSRLNTIGSSSGSLSNRNILINGSMNISQRSASVTGIGASAGYFTCDRWRIEVGGTAGRFTQTQTGDGPNGISANCLKLDCTTADTSIAASEYLILTQCLEGQDLQRIAKGTSDAKKVTLSFYVKANAAFTFVAEFQDNTNSRLIGKTFATTTDWVRHEITFDADTTGAFNDDNAEGGRINFWLHSGASYSGGTLPSGWYARSGNDVNRAAGIGSFFSSTDNNFFITGVQLEVGPQSTPFEVEPYSATLAKCQRYFFLETTTATDSSGRLGVGSGAATVVFDHTLPVQMRTKPSVSLTNANIRIGDMVAQGFTTSSGTVTINTYSGSQSVTYSLGGFSGLTSYRSYLHEPSAASPGMVKFDAELG